MEIIFAKPAIPEPYDQQIAGAVVVSLFLLKRESSDTRYYHAPAFRLHLQVGQADLTAR
jgi:hypothetical protein